MNYWIFIANDTKWDWLKDQQIDEIEEWSAIEENGSRVKRYFKKVKKGDLVIGYSSGKLKSFVSIGKIEKPYYRNSNQEDVISIRKTYDLEKPVSLEKVIQMEPFNTKLAGPKMNTTAMPLSFDEYQHLLSLFNSTFIDSYDDVDIVLNTKKTPIDEALKLRPRKRSDNGYSWNRNPSISKSALERVEYKCELESEKNSHNSFVAHCTKKNYVEAHHLIPMKAQENFDYSLDNALNIVALCPNCHRMIHHGERSIVKEKLIELYEKRKNDLEEFELSQKDLLKFYNV